MSIAFGLAGVVLLLAWVALMLIFAGPRWGNWATGLSGIVLLAVYLYQERQMVKRVVLSPQMRFGSNALIFSVTVVAVVALLNVIASRHSFRTDLTADKFFSLSEQTGKILASLDRKVKIIFFHKTNTPSPQIMGLLDQYKHASKQLDVEVIDIDKKPELAKSYKIKYDNTVIVLTGDKEKHVVPQDLFAYQFRGGRQPQREFKGESVITAAILSVSKAKQTTAYFLEGHGERSIEDTAEQGLSQIKVKLEQDNYIVKSLNLLNEGKLPEDADIIVIAGPQRSLREPERKLIGEYLDQEGRLLVMLELESSGGLEEVLKPWGVKILSGMVVDPRRYYAFANPTFPAPQYRSHKITDDLQKQNVPVILPAACALEAGTLDTGSVVPLLETTAESWLETDWRKRAKHKYDSGKDTRGPLVLGLAVSRNPVSAPLEPGAPPAPAKPTPKLVVFGNVQWITNQLESWQANFDLVANAVNWLAGSEETISIRSKQISRRVVYMDNVKARLMWWTTLLLTPLAVVSVGLLQWWRRRSL